MEGHKLKKSVSPFGKTKGVAFSIPLPLRKPAGSPPSPRRGDLRSRREAPRVGGRRALPSGQLSDQRVGGWEAKLPSRLPDQRGNGRREAPAPSQRPLALRA